MKCHVCNYNIPAEKKFCPGCGRVLSPAEQKLNRLPDDSVTENTIIYRPASSENKDAVKNPDIAGIFSKDHDSPEYRDSHAYNKATYDVLEYDKMFLSRSDDKEDSSDSDYNDDSYDFSDSAESIFADDPNKIDEHENIVITAELETYELEEPQPKRPFNAKLLVICIIIVAGVAVIITGAYRVGQQIGLWGENKIPTQSFEDEAEKPSGEKAPVVKETEKTTTSKVSDYKIGIYTVTGSQNTVFMQKSKTDERIIATVPTGTVLEITEIADDKGKATYGEYTGWINLEDLEYTPDATVTVIETTTKVPEITSEEDVRLENIIPEDINPEDISEPADRETTTVRQIPDSPGTYTVDLQGDGTYLNLRKSASIDGEIVATIPDGSRVVIDDIIAGWGHACTDDGNEGWIYMIYLR